MTDEDATAPAGDTGGAGDEEGARLAAALVLALLGPEPEPRPEGAEPPTIDELIEEAGFEEARAYWKLVDDGVDPAYLDGIKEKWASGTLMTPEQSEAFDRVYAAVLAEEKK